MTRKQEWSIATHLFNVNDRRRDSLLRNPFTLEKQKLFLTNSHTTLKKKLLGFTKL